MKKIFLDVKVGDKVVVCDQYSHDYVEHLIEIESIEYDKHNTTETNPKGMTCYGKDLTWWDEELNDYSDDDYITRVEESNFIRFYEEENTMIKNATFTSVWDGGHEVTTNCKVDMETREVFDIEMLEVDESLKNLDYEYIVIDGENFDVFSVDEVEDANFWYK